MSNGILQTALERLPLELEYRQHFILESDECVLVSESANRVSSFQQNDPTLRDEFECLLSAI